MSKRKHDSKDCQNLKLFFTYKQKKYVGLMRQLYSGIYSGIIYVLRDVIAPYSREYIIF